MTKNAPKSPKNRKSDILLIFQKPPCKFGGYSANFEALTLDELRLPPNVFDILAQDNSQKPNSRNDENFDIFLSYSLKDSIQAIKRKEIDAPPSYDESVMQTNVDPRTIAKFMRENMNLKIYISDKNSDQNLLESARALSKSKVFIACLSDESQCPKTEKTRTIGFTKLFFGILSKKRYKTTKNIKKKCFGKQACLWSFIASLTFICVP